MTGPDSGEDDPMLKRTVIHTPAGAVPAEKPAGAMNSVFDTSAAPSAPAAPKPAKNAAQERNRRVLLDVLERGEGSGAALAKVAGIAQATTSRMLRELVEEGLVESNGRKGSQIRFRLKAKTAAGGFHAWLAKKGEASAEGRESGRKKVRPAQPSTRAAGTGPTATRTHRTEVRGEPTLAPTWSCALESSGHLVIRANGETVTLDAQQARGVTAWLQRVDAALAAALEV